MDVQKHIDYWRIGSEENLAIARLLVENGHVAFSLFTAHLAIEKMLKAHVTKTTGNMPPKIHKLVRLAELAGLSLSKDQRDFLASFQFYNIEGRYADLPTPSPDLATARRELAAAEEMIEWLRHQL